MKLLRKTMLCASLTFFTISEASAQTAAEILPPELTAEINSILSSALNGLAVFGNSNALGSGSFSYGEDEGSETDLDVLRFSADFYIGEEKNVPVAPFVRVLLGNVKLTESIAPETGQGVGDFSVTESFTAGLGAGVDLRLAKNIFLTPSMLVSYNHTENKYDFNDPTSADLAIFNREIFNWDLDSMGYMPGVELRYDAPVAAKSIITPSISYNQLFLDSYWTNSSILEVNSSSGILVSGLKADLATGVQLLSGSLSVVPNFKRTDIFGDAEEGLGFDHYYDASFGMIIKEQTMIPFLSEFGITGGYGFADDFDGFRIGFDARLS